MKRSRKEQQLIDDMNKRSKEHSFNEYEEGNYWLHIFLMKCGNYNGFSVLTDENGNEYCHTL